MEQKTFLDPETRRSGMDNLMIAARILKDSGATYWCEAGTCLALVRGGRLIDHDADIDIGILPLNAQQVWEIERIFQERGFDLAFRWGTPDKGYELSFLRRGVKVDLFFFAEDGDTIWHAAWWRGRMIRFEFPADTILPPAKDRMAGVEIPRPKRAAEYLQLRYGPDWRTPDPLWRWNIDPHCIAWSKSEIKKADMLEP